MKKTNYLYIFLIALIIIIITLAIVFIMKLFYIEKTDNSIINYAKTNNLDARQLKENFINKSDSVRAKNYLNDIIKDIKERNIDKLYSSLNIDFKNKYFDSKDKFEQYIKSFLPLDITYSKMGEEIIGDLMIFKLKVWDFSDSNFATRNNMYFVIKEKSLGLYEFSFSVSENVVDENSINDYISEEELANRKPE